MCSYLGLALPKSGDHLSKKNFQLSSELALSWVGDAVTKGEHRKNISNGVEPVWLKTAVESDEKRLNSSEALSLRKCFHSIGLEPRGHTVLGYYVVPAWPIWHVDHSNFKLNLLNKPHGHHQCRCWDHLFCSVVNYEIVNCGVRKHMASKFIWSTPILQLLLYFKLQRCLIASPWQKQSNDHLERRLVDFTFCKPSALQVKIPCHTAEMATY